MTQTEAAAQLFHLATSARPPAQPHLFGPKLYCKPDPDRGRHEQHEKACPVCALVRITVIPKQGEGWREYRFGDGVQFQRDRDPECGGAVTLEFAK